MKENELQFLYEADGRKYYRSFYDGIEVIWLQDVHNPYDLLISAESFAQIHGFASLEEMMADDATLDKINEYMTETGSPFPFVKTNMRN